MDLVTRERVETLHDHTKYVVRTVWSPDGRWIATLGYDKQLIVYQVIEGHQADPDAPVLLEGEEPDELATAPSLRIVQSKVIRTRTNPEAAVFLPDSSCLVWAARDDNMLHELRLPAAAVQDPERDWSSVGYNLNENKDNWVSFSV